MCQVNENRKVMNPEIEDKSSLRDTIIIMAGFAVLLASVHHGSPLYSSAQPADQVVWCFTWSITGKMTDLSLWRKLKMYSAVIHILPTQAQRT